MDGYSNWRGGGGSEDDSYDFGTGRRGGGGGGVSKKGGGSSDVYDFEIDADPDDDDYEVAPRASRSQQQASSSSSSSNTLRNSDTRRLSTDERTQAILNRNQGAATSSTTSVQGGEGGGGYSSSIGGGGADVSKRRGRDVSLEQRGSKVVESEDFDSWRASMNELLEGIHSPDAGGGGGGGGHSDSGGSSIASSPLSPLGNNRSLPLALGGANNNKDSPAGSMGDSLDISAADLEVGEYAKRRANEKTTDRRRRESLVVAPHASSQAANKSSSAPKVAASPDISSAKSRGAGGGAGANAAGGGGLGRSRPMGQFSAALSSIQRSEDGSDDESSRKEAKEGIVRYGSVDHSDGDFYRKLGAGGNKSARTTRGHPEMSDFTQGDEDDDDEEEGEDDDGSGESELAQSSEFDRQRGGRGGVGGEDRDGDGDYSSDDFEQDMNAPSKFSKAAMEEESRRKRESIQMEELRQRWLAPSLDENTILGRTAPPVALSTEATETTEAPVAADAAAAAASAEEEEIGGAHDEARTKANEANDVREGEDGDEERDQRHPLPPLSPSQTKFHSDDSGSDQVNRHDSLLESEEDPAGQDADSNNDSLQHQEDGDATAMVGMRLITAVGSASMVTSIPPPPPPLMSESAEVMMTTMASSDGIEGRSRTSLLNYSNLEEDSRREQAFVVPPPPAHDDHPEATAMATTTTTSATAVAKGDSLVAPSRQFGASISARYVDDSEADTSLLPEGGGEGGGGEQQRGFSYEEEDSQETKPPAYSEQYNQPPVHLEQPSQVVFGHSLEVGDGRDALAVGSNLGVDAFGKTATISGGQPYVSKIVAVEIDPLSLGLDGKGKVATSLTASRKSSSPPPKRNASQNHQQHQVDTSVRVTTWPKELPLTDASTQELHAHIAMMEETQKRRLSASTAAKIKRFKDKVTDKKGDASTMESKRASSTGGSRSTSTAGGKSSAGGAMAVVPSAVNRLEQGTARLARQFEQMEKEMRSLKGSVKSDIETAAASAAARSIVHASPSSTPLRRKVKGSSPSAIPLKGRRTSQLPREESQGAGGGNDREDFTNDGSGVWKSVALQTMKEIVDESEKLAEKERALRAREEAIRIKESLSDYDRRSNAAGADVYSGLGPKVSAAPQVSQALVDARQREERLMSDIEQLKAQIYELQLEKENAEEKRLEEKKITYRRSSRYTQPAAGGAEEDEMISVSKREYEGLLAEVESQEILIVGFQKENEKLVREQQTRNAEENSRKAQFFDKQETLNKELNRLRNSTVGEMAGVRKSADVLRAELELDATIRNLKERLAIAESGAGEREKELQLTIDKLRKENRQLASEAGKVSVGILSGNNEATKAMEETQRRHDEEISSLRGKLAWYAENQVLIEDAEKQRGELSQLVGVLKKELRKRGMDAKALASLTNSSSSSGVKGAGVDYETVGDTSMLSTTTKGRSFTGGGGRSLQSDIKKIKELEETVRDLQDSLRKRNPDSVANLIRAATLSESVQLERRNQDEEIADLRSQLTVAKDDYDMRLRSLRQEHEKIKVQYVARIADLESKGATATASAVAPSAASGGKATPGLPMKNLTQANSRIRELEDECERVRTFYTKKVEETQRKSDAQIRALKRGGAGGSDEEAALVLAVDAVKKEYDSRMEMLEAELLSTAEELGKAKAKTAARGSGSDASLPFSSSVPIAPVAAGPVAVTTAMIRADPSWTLEVEKEVDLRVTKMRLALAEQQQQQAASSSIAPPPPPPAPIVSEGELQRLRDDRDRLAAETRESSAQWTQERDGLWKRVREEESRVAHMTMEVSALRAQVQQQTASPQMAQIMQMESSLAQVETRLQRRERELMSALEEGRTAAKMERARMDAIHAQEIREKDEQLVRFQNELEQLVLALRQWQYAATYGPPPPHERELQKDVSLFAN